MKSYFNCHTHTALGSNIRLLDSINKVKDVIDKSIELGLCGVAITDHECLSAHIEAEKYMQSIQEQHPDFKLALGNEIYLTEDRSVGQKYYHFILIAKDALGHRALRELSSFSWMNSYRDRKLERVPTTKEELKSIVQKYEGHLIATTACIGGELGSTILLYRAARSINDQENSILYYNQINNFLTYCQELFTDDFYIECAPGTSEEQKIVNDFCYKIASVYNIKLIVGTDAHYLTKEERSVHKAYLNSKEGDREIDSFYEFTYLMDYEEVTTLLSKSFSDIQIAEQIADNTLELYDKIERYSLFHKQSIPTVKVKDYPKSGGWMFEHLNSYDDRYKHLKAMLVDDDVQNRYWINECLNKLNEIDKFNEIYLDELEEEARVKSIIGEKLETNMFKYPNTLQHYIDLIWDCGSMVGAGRGSSCAALNHYLLGITQLDPIKWELPFFRYLNEERVELGSLLLILPSCKKRM